MSIYHGEHTCACGSVQAEFTEILKVFSVFSVNSVVKKLLKISYRLCHTL